MEDLTRTDQRVLSLPRDFDRIDAVSGDRSKSEWILRRLENDGDLVRVRRGLYAVRSAKGTIRADTWELLANAVPEHGFVTGGRALMHWELNDQWSRNFTIMADRGIRDWSWRKDTVTYIKVPKAKLWGAKLVTTPAGKVRVAKPERAILDSLAHPAADVSLAQIAQAISLSLSRDVRFAEKLALGARRYGNQSIMRRCALLVSVLGGEGASNPFRSYVKAWKDVVPLSTRAERLGEIDPVWRVRENISIDMLAGRATQVV